MASTPSETSIANNALNLLGERRIESLDDATKTAKTVKDVFDDVRDELLRSHSWNFATKRAQLAADATAPLWGFDHAYTLPSDYLRLLSLGWGGNAYAHIHLSHWVYTIEGGKILTDLDAPLSITYTARITNPVQWDSSFRQTLAAALAYECAEAITGTTSMTEQMEALYAKRLRTAKAIDGQEPSNRQVGPSSFLDAREETGLERGIPDNTGIPL